MIWCARRPDPMMLTRTIAYTLFFLLFSAGCFGASAVATGNDGLVVDQPVIEKILADYLEAKRGFLPQARISFKAQRFPASFVLPEAN